METNSPLSLSKSTAAAETAHFMSRVYGWMTLGIAMSGLVAWNVVQNPVLLEMIFQNRAVFWTIVISQFGLVMFLTMAMNRVNATVAGLLYFLYSALTGVTLSVVFLLYTQSSLASTFFLTAFSFAGLSAFGYVTKRDLGPIGSFCMMGLFGLIGYSILSMIFPSLYGSMGNLISGMIGVLVFAGLTAYDTQKVKSFYQGRFSGADGDRKGAIFGALTLYLDFINLFLSLLRIMGRRR